MTLERFDSFVDDQTSNDLISLARQALERGEAEKARQICENGLLHGSHHIKLLMIAAIASRAQGSFDQAQNYISKAIEISPENPVVHSLLGDILLLKKEPKAAIEALMTAISYEDTSSQTYFNLGTAYLNSEKFEIAKYWFDRALAQDPTMVSALVNKGLCEQSLMRLDDALNCFDQALHIDPENIDAKWNASHVLLCLGHYEAGFALYETRWQNPKIKLKPRHFQQPKWLGKQDLSGKTLLLNAEGGFGDTIQFIRYAKLFSSDVNLVLQCQPPLLELIASMGLHAKIISTEEKPPAFDFYCPMMSLPFAFGTSFESVPAFEFYLRAPVEKQKTWQSEIISMKGPKIGIVARGNSKFSNDHNRSIGLANLIKYLPKEYNYVLLQKEISNEELIVIRAHGNITAPAEMLHSFSDTAALCALMDLVISVDTSVAHLAGALGRPTIVLIPHRADWRWGQNGNKTPWYSSVQLLRQEQHAQWDQALSKYLLSCIANALGAEKTVAYNKF